MSLAIISECEFGECLIACTDSMATLGSISADNIAKKDAPLHKDWTALYVGNDMGHAPWIVRRAQTLLGREGNRKVEQVASAISQAYDERRQQQIERKFLRRLGYTSESFRESAKRKMTETAYNRILEKMANSSLKCQFLVGGFEARAQIKLFTLDEDDEPMSCDDLGFWAIGSGAAVALGALGFFAEKSLFGRTNSVEETVYFLCQAKFTSEAAVRSVGRETTIFIRRFNDSDMQFVSPLGMHAIRRAWEKRGAPRVPRGIEKEIPKWIYSMKDLMNPSGGFNIENIEKVFIPKKRKIKPLASQSPESKQ